MTRANDISSFQKIQNLKVEKNLQLQKLFTLNSSTWIIHGSSLPDCHALLATTMLFKIYVVGCEATGYAAVVLHRKYP